MPNIPIEGLSLFRNPDIDSKEKYERLRMGTPLTSGEDPEDATIVGSKREDGTHALLLDMDIPTHYIPSSTPGHGHLYVDCHLTFEQLMKVMTVLAEVGLIDPPWVKLTELRGMASLRTPWTRKPKPAWNGIPPYPVD